MRDTDNKPKEIVTFRISPEAAAKVREIAQQHEWTFSFTMARLVSNALQEEKPKPVGPQKAAPPKRKTKAA